MTFIPPDEPKGIDNHEGYEMMDVLEDSIIWDEFVYVVNENKFIDCMKNVPKFKEQYNSVKPTYTELLKVVSFDLRMIEFPHSFNSVFVEYEDGFKSYMPFEALELNEDTLLEWSNSTNYTEPTEVLYNGRKHIVYGINNEPVELDDFKPKPDYM